LENRIEKEEIDSYCRFVQNKRLKRRNSREVEKEYCGGRGRAVGPVVSLGDGRLPPPGALGGVEEEAVGEAIGGVQGAEGVGGPPAHLEGEPRRRRRRCTPPGGPRERRRPVAGEAVGIATIVAKPNAHRRYT